MIQSFLVKDKASVLAEVAKLQEIRDELTSEIASLHAQLEQERSKTRTSNVDVKSSKQSVRDIRIVIIIYNFNSFFTMENFILLCFFFFSEQKETG